MPGDKTRTSNDLSEGYKSPVMQQGRVILDRDFNVLGETLGGAIAADARDCVGPCGTPDGGFTISIPKATPQPATFDFLISPGTMYVGGERAVISAPANGALSYFNQPDWINPPAPSPTPPAVEFVYLDLCEQEVGGVEDPDLMDVALGGPDTSQRLRLMRRVKRLAMSAGNCTAALTQASQTWLSSGFLFDAPTMRLLPQAKLQVGLIQSLAPQDPCDPVAQGGYLGADNQLIRVQLSDGGEGATGGPWVLWGFDNASFLYRVTVVAATGGATLLLNQTPVDAFRSPQAGQVVEILRTQTVLGTAPDQSGTPGAPGITRCVAMPSGVVRSLTQAYDPTTGNVVLNSGLPADFLNDTNPLFMRVWQAQLPLSAGAAIPLTYLQGTGGTATQISTGLQVTITMNTNNGQVSPPPIGAYWMFAVRPATPQGVYPERLLMAGQAPDGPRQWVCPLAVLDWPAVAAPTAASPPVQICGLSFENLVELSAARLDGCCSVTLRPQDLAANPAAIQNALNQFANASQGVSVCLMSGLYSLSQPILFDSRHNGLTLQACHGGVTIQALQGKEPNFLQGLVTLAACDSITIGGITFQPPFVELVPAIANLTTVNSLKTLAGQLNDPFMQIGLRLLDCTSLVVEECEFTLTEKSGVGNFGACILANGNCAGLRVRQSLFSGPARRRFRIFDPVPIHLEAAATEKLVGAAAAPQAKVNPDVKLPNPPPAPPADSPTPAPAPAAATAANTTITHHTFTDIALKLNTTNPGLVAATDPSLTEPVALPLATTPPPVSLSALLMMPSIDPNFVPAPATGNTPAPEANLLAQTILDQAEFTGNRMQGLTVSILGSAVTGVVKLKDNTITDCMGGIVFASLGTDNVASAGEFQSGVQSYMQQGVNANQAMQVATWYPLPQPSAITTRVTLSTRFHVVDNIVEALPGDLTTSGPACFLWIIALSDTSNTAPDLNTSILCNSNQLRNRSDPSSDFSSLFGATALLVGAANTVVNGNLIRNMQTSTGAGKNSVFALVVFPGEGGVEAIVGNVVVGANNLAGPRNDVTFSQPANTDFVQLAAWKFLNDVNAPA